MALVGSNREKILMMVTGGLAVFYVFYSFMLSPMLDERAKLKGRLSQGTTELKLMESKIKALESVEKELDQARSKRLLTMSDGELSLNVLRRLADATAASDLTLLRVKPVEEKEKNNGVKFELNYAGSYQELNVFLKRLFSLDDVVMFIDSMTIKGGGTSLPRLDIGLQVTAYL